MKLVYSYVLAFNNMNNLNINSYIIRKGLQIEIAPVPISSCGTGCCI